jgi:hypothetical protein
MERIDEKDDLEALHKQILKNIRDSRMHFSKWRTDAREDYDFYAGEQWSVEDKGKMAEEGCPSVVFNRTARTINAVSGLEIQNRQEVRYQPREMSDAGKSEMMTNAVRWVRESCDAEDEESEAFLDSLITGIAAIENRLDYEEDPEGKIIEERFDAAAEAIMDHTARKKNFADRRFGGRIKKITTEDYERQFPEHEVPKGQIVGSSDEDQPYERDERNPYNREMTDPKDVKGEVQIAKYEYYEVYNVYIISDEQGQPVEVPEDRYEAIKNVMAVEGVKMPRRKYWRCFLDAEKIMVREESPCNMFSIEFITGLRDRNNNTWFGLLRLTKDPQRWANKWMSQIMHILNTQAKSGKVVYEEGALSNPRKFADEWSDPAMPAKLNAGGLNKFKQMEASRYPDGIDRLLQYAISAVNDTAGVNVELLGLADRDQPGVLEEQRKQAGITILAQFFDGLRRFRKAEGRILAAYTRDYLSDGRLIKILGEEGAQYVPLLKDELTMKYDIIVDDAPTNTNMKERVYKILVPVLDTALRAGIPVPPEVLDYAPLPEALTQKWKAFIRKQGEDPQVQQAKQLQTGKQMADIKETQSQAMLNEAKAQQALADGPEMQREKNMADHQLKREKMGMDYQLKLEKMMADMALKQTQDTAALVQSINQLADKFAGNSVNNQ